MKKSSKSSPVVYSTEHGRMCPGCNQPAVKCQCIKRSGPPAGDGIVRIGRQTKGRKGKGVTVITGVPLDNNGLKELAKNLKKKMGVGGSIKEGAIEIQGDHQEIIFAELCKLGWVVKKSGG